MSLSEAKNLFEHYIGAPSENCIALPQSGSARQNFIGTHLGKKYIITSNANIAENESFFYFSTQFTKLGLNTPHILSISEDRKTYIQTYVGENTLFDIIQKEQVSDRVKDLIKKSLDKLYTLQTATQDKIDYSHTFEYTSYSSISQGILHPSALIRYPM